MTGTEGFIYGATTVVVLDLLVAFIRGFVRRIRSKI